MMPLTLFETFTKNPVQRSGCRLLNYFFVSYGIILSQIVSCLRSLLVVRGSVLGLRPIVLTIVNFYLRFRRIGVIRSTTNIRQIMIVVLISSSFKSGDLIDYFMSLKIQVIEDSI